LIKYYPYRYKISSMEYFENNDNYDTVTKRYKGSYGGLLEYSSNKLDEVYRYVGGKTNDHHPSYFSNKIFYTDIIRKFISDETDLNFDETYFNQSDIIEFEKFLKILLVKKSKTNEWENYEYSDLQRETIQYIRKNILK